MANAFDLYNWAWGIEGLKQGELTVLLALVSYANKRGECFPSKQALAKRAACSEVSLNRHLGALKKAGLVEVSPRFDSATGRQTSSLYRLNAGGSGPCG